MMGAGRLQERVAFDEEVTSDDGHGGENVTWETRHTCNAEFRYERGKEAGQAGRLTGSAVFKVRVRQCTEVKAINTETYRLRDVRRSVVYNIREIDVITDRAYAWLVCESGVAI